MNPRLNTFVIKGYIEHAFQVSVVAETKQEALDRLRSGNIAFPDISRSINEKSIVVLRAFDANGRPFDE